MEVYKISQYQFSYIIKPLNLGAKIKILKKMPHRRWVVYPTGRSYKVNINEFKNLIEKYPCLFSNENENVVLKEKLKPKRFFEIL